MKDLLEVARSRNLRVLLAGRLVSAGGDFVYQVALSIAIFAYSGHSSLAVSAFWIVRLAPPLVLGSPVGALADKLGYRRSMIIADLGRLVLVALMALIARPATWGLLYPLILVVAGFSCLFNPASVGLVPQLVEDRDQRMAANAVIGEVSSIASIVGSAIAGVLAGAGFTTWLLLGDAASFGISALSLMLIQLAPGGSAGGEEADEETEEDEVGGSFLGGFRLLSRRPLLVFAASVMAFPELTSGAILVWIVPYAQEALHLGGAGVGYLSAALGVGAVVGGLVAAGIGNNVRLDALLAVGVGILGAAMIVFGLIHVAVAAIACLIVLGLAETLEYTAYETLLQQSVPENMIGRAAGTMDTLFFNLVLVGNLVSGLLAATLGLTISIAGLGVAIVLVTLLAWIKLQRQSEGEPDAESLETVPAFQGVPEGVREWAVRRMVREQYAPGTVIISQGEEGHTFYMIAKGTAQVEMAADGGTLEVQLSRGNFFGEISLLEEVPRTATVRAVDKLTVYSMTREDFDELRSRTPELSRSLLETASARQEQNRNFRLTLADRLT